MRDFNVKELQDFLTNNNVQFETKPAKEQVEAAKQKLEEERAREGDDDEDEIEEGECMCMN